MQQLSLNLEFIIILKSKTFNKLLGVYFSWFVVGSFAQLVVFCLGGTDFWGCGVFWLVLVGWFLFGVFLVFYWLRLERDRTREQQEKLNLVSQKLATYIMIHLCYLSQWNKDPMREKDLSCALETHSRVWGNTKQQPVVS